jgi:hypothetical protein
MAYFCSDEKIKRIILLVLFWNNFHGKGTTKADLQPS